MLDQVIQVLREAICSGLHLQVFYFLLYIGDSVLRHIYWVFKGPLLRLLLTIFAKESKCSHLL